MPIKVLLVLNLVHHRCALSLPLLHFLQGFGNCICQFVMKLVFAFLLNGSCRGLQVVHQARQRPQALAGQSVRALHGFLVFSSLLLLHGCLFASFLFRTLCAGSLGNFHWLLFTVGRDDNTDFCRLLRRRNRFGILGW